MGLAVETLINKGYVAKVIAHVISFSWNTHCSLNPAHLSPPALRDLPFFSTVMLSAIDLAFASLDVTGY